MTEALRTRIERARECAVTALLAERGPKPEVQAALKKMLRENPRQHIRAAAWRKWHNDGNAAHWESVLRRGNTRQQGCGQ